MDYDNALKSIMKKLKPIMSHVSVGVQRSTQNRVAGACLRRFKVNPSFEEITVDNCTAVKCLPEGMTFENSDKVALYLHGGAYIAGGVEYCKGFGGIVAGKFNLPVLACAYRLAPENPFPAALLDALSCYKYLLDYGYDPNNILLFGESAGGGLVFSLCHKLIECNLPLPNTIIAISPWSDLTMSGDSYVYNADKDPLLSYQALRLHLDDYLAGNDPKSPLISPVYGDKTGFPRSIIFVGGDEVLLEDSIMLNKRLIADGCESELVIQPGMWHVYPLYKPSCVNEFFDKFKEYLP